MQSLPDPRPLPRFQATPTGTATAEAHLGGQFLPADAGAQDEEDAAERLAGRDGRATAVRLGRFRGDQRGDRLPKRVTDLLFPDALALHAPFRYQHSCHGEVLKRALRHHPRPLRP